MIIYKSIASDEWYIDHAFEKFGNIFQDYTNLLLNLKSRETFEDYCNKVYIELNKSKDGTFLNKNRVFLNFVEEIETPTGEKKISTEKGFATYYKLYEYIGEELQKLADEVDVYSNTKNNRIQYAPDLYFKALKIIYIVWSYIDLLKLNKIEFGGDPESAKDFLPVFESVVDELENNKECEMLQGFTVENVKYKGYKALKIDNECLSFKTYEINNVMGLMSLYAEDLMENLLSDSAEKLRKCNTCGLLFVPAIYKNHYCPICEKLSNYEKYVVTSRKKDAERLKHKQIMDYIRNVLKYGRATEDERTKAFLDESNYYNQIRKGKKPEHNQKYRNDILNNDDYMEWLNGKMEQFKAEKRGDAK